MQIGNIFTVKCRKYSIKYFISYALLGFRTFGFTHASGPYPLETVKIKPIDLDKTDHPV